MPYDGNIIADIIETDINGIVNGICGIDNKTISDSYIVLNSINGRLQHYLYHTMWGMPWLGIIHDDLYDFASWEPWLLKIFNSLIGVDHIPLLYKINFNLDNIASILYDVWDPINHALKTVSIP